MEKQPGSNGPVFRAGGAADNRAVDALGCRAIAAVVLVVAVCIGGSLLSPLASPPVAGPEQVRLDMRVFPDRKSFNVLILPFSDPHDVKDDRAGGLSRIEEQLLHSLKSGSSAAGGRMDAEFLLPVRMPASVLEARDIAARYGADFVVLGKGLRTSAAHVADLPPPGARGPAGYIWSVPVSLPAEAECLSRFIFGSEAASAGFFEDGVMQFERAAEICGRFSPQVSGRVVFHAASCALAGGDERAAVHELVRALNDPEVALAARRNLDTLMAGHFAGFADHAGSFGPPEKRLPRSGAVVSESALDMLMDNYFQGYDGALKRYFQAVSLQLKPAEAHAALGEVLEVVFGDPAGAVREYEAAHTDDSGAFMPLYRAAAVSENLPGREREAARLYEAALEIQFDPWAANNLGVLKENVFGDLRGAEALYQKAREARPDFFEPVRNLALLYARRLNGADELSAQARITLEAALELRPNDPEMNAELGLLLARNKDSAGEAARYLEAALKSDPSSAGAHHVLALLKRDKLGKPGEARKHYLAAVELNPVLRSSASDRAFYVREVGAGSDSAFRTVRGKIVRFAEESGPTAGTKSSR